MVIPLQVPVPTLTSKPRKRMLPGLFSLPLYEQGVKRRFEDCLLLCFRDGFDLAEDALREGLHNDATAGGLGGEVLCIDFVEGGKIAHVSQEAGGLDYVVKGSAGGLQNGADVFTALRCLGSDPFRNASVRRIRRDRAGGEDKAVYGKCLGVGTDGARCKCCFDLFHMLFFHSLMAGDPNQLSAVRLPGLFSVIISPE